ncbi:endothelin-converting enzyme 1-like [Convolutriloba macropyga]|uniref:endothelin-converting enzyme 1-like n=1 Tax=Convolutriloba macropyga TaxID=536237 RepID=UPI003F51C678
MTDFWSGIKSRSFFVAQNLVSLFLLSAVGILLTLVILGSKEEKNDNLDPNYASESAQILAAMNREADPCEDFYEYACGGYSANEPVNLDSFDTTLKFSVNTLSMLPRMFNKIVENPEDSCSSELKMAQLYHSCMDEFATVDHEGSLDIKFMNTTLQQMVESVHEWFQNKFGFNIYKSVSAHDQYRGPYHVIMWPGDRLWSRNVDFASPFFMYNPHTRGENNIEIGLPEDSKIEVLLPIRDSEINEKVLEFILDLIYDHLNSYSEDKVTLFVMYEYTTIYPKYRSKPGRNQIVLYGGQD